jgi:putative ABC transport system permease protein
MSRVMAAHSVGIALDALRANRVRALLTTSGMVVGVATVMAMASLITGVREAVMEDVVAIGPDNFVVERFDMSGVRLAELGEGRVPWLGAPPITVREAELLAQLPSVRSATPAVSGSTEVRLGRTTVTGVDVEGSGTEWTGYKAGSMSWGRNFLQAELERSAAVVILSEGLALEVFGRREPTVPTVHMGGTSFRVVGVYRQAGNLFAAETDRWVVAPYTTAIKHLPVDDEWLEVRVVPEAPRASAMSDVTAALRSARGLRPGTPNHFALTGQEAVQTMFDDTTRTFFAVMLLLSSLGLMVGGVGVVAVMMISVTERTREIGVRKSLGATRRAILWQFLLEAVAVTLAGGTVGILLAGSGALLLARFTPVPAAVPLWSVLAGLGVSLVCGLVFGIVPASRAARLDPVEALRHQ